MLSLVTGLTYRCYVYNRQLNPQVSPERWGVIFGAEQVAAMEEKFQAEQVRDAEIALGAHPQGCQCGDCRLKEMHEED